MQQIVCCQTGCGANERMGEHNLAIRSTTSKNLAIHCKDCRCQPYTSSAAVLGRYAARGAREIVESFHIITLGNNCISGLSVGFTKKEVEFAMKKTRLYVVYYVYEHVNFLDGFTIFFYSKGVAPLLNVFFRLSFTNKFQLIVSSRVCFKSLPSFAL